VTGSGATRGVTRRALRPTTSAAAYPNSRSAAADHPRTTPSVSIAYVIASAEDSNSVAVACPVHSALEMVSPQPAAQ